MTTGSSPKVGLDMIKKAILGEQPGAMRVTFTLPNSMWADQIYLVGDFNGWNTLSHPMKQDRSGNWTLSLDLPICRVFQFRYLFDNGQWTNDGDADCYVYNPYGCHNFVVVTDPAFQRHLEPVQKRNGNSAVPPMLNLTPTAPTSTVLDPAA